MKRRALIPLIRLAILLLAAVCILGTWWNLSRFPRTEDAEVRADVAGVAPQVGGTIVKLHVSDNQAVRQGDLLFEIDPRTYEAEAARARARLGLVELEVRAREDDISAAQATLHERQAKAAYARSYFERLKPLLEGNYASADRVQRAETEALAAEALVREAEAAVGRAQNALGEVDGKNTRIEEARAAAKDAALRVSYCRVYAPCDGFVTDLQIAPGSYAPAGGQVFSIVDSSAWYVLANFRETDLARIRPGQRATVYLMSRRGKPFHGLVQGISRAVYPLATASRATPGGEGIFSRVEPTFDFVQLAQRFPVRIILDGGDASAWRMGGKAAVSVDTASMPDPDAVQRLEKRTREGFLPPLE